MEFCDNVLLFKIFISFYFILFHSVQRLYAACLTEHIVYSIGDLLSDDYFADAEMMYIVQQTYNNLTAKEDNNDIHYFINHKSIFSAIIELCHTDQQPLINLLVRCFEIQIYFFNEILQ